MKFKYLKDYDHSKTLDSFTYDWIKGEEAKQNKTTALTALYCAYIECVKRHVGKYSILSITSSEAFDAHLKGFIGFIYSELECENSLKYNYSAEVKIVFNSLAEKLGFKKSNILISFNKISDEANTCIEIYKKNKPNKEKIKYYKGWEIISNDDKNINLNISFAYDKYGKEFTDKLHNALKLIGKKTIATTLSKKVGFAISLLRILTKAYSTLKKMKKALSAEFAFETMLVVYNLGLIEAKLKKYNIGHYHKRWSSIVDTYYNLINYGVWEEPITEILRPLYKKSTYKNTSTNLIKNSKSELIHCKLVTPIPISYTDNEAKEFIFNKIIKEVKHIIYCSKILAKETMDQYNYFIDTSNLGSIKKFSGNNQKYEIVVGEFNEANTYKTYFHQPFIHKKLKNYQHFLGISGNSLQKNKIKNGLFNFSYNKLYPLLILLINEHPSITESWLINWKLYDKNNNLGLFQISENWYTKSYKKRRGVQHAEQLIKLNENSKKIIENIIKFTNMARKFLKSENNPDSEYMLLTSRTAFSKPQRVKKIENGTSVTLINNLKKSFEITSYSNEKIIIHKDETKNIFENLTLTRFRASCAVRVYYETMSVYQMSIALGHKEYNQKLIDSYLPDTLWKFYTNRWVRIFQNALIYESMKNSKILFQVIDFTEAELGDFINNHAFKDIPFHIEKGAHEIKIENINNDEKLNYIGIFPITVPLLQIFIAVKIFFENLKNDNLLIKESLKWWYTSAAYVINQIESSNKELKQCVYLTKDIYKMFDIAKKNPIKQNLLNGILLYENK